MQLSGELSEGTPQEQTVDCTPAGACTHNAHCQMLCSSVFGQSVLSFSSRAVWISCISCV